MPPETGHMDGLGFLIFAIVAGSFLFIVVATVIGRPRNPRVTLIVLGTLLALFVATVAGMWVGGHVFGLLMS